MSASKPNFTKISQWIDAGNMDSGYYLCESPQRETSKAVAFAAKKVNAYGYMSKALAWFPKSQLLKVENDYYTNGGSEMYLVPSWLLSAKEREGYEV